MIRAGDIQRFLSCKPAVFGRLGRASGEALLQGGSGVAALMTPAVVGGFKASVTLRLTRHMQQQTLLCRQAWWGQTPSMTIYCKGRAWRRWWSSLRSWAALRPRCALFAGPTPGSCRRVGLHKPQCVKAHEYWATFKSCLPPPLRP